MKISREEYEVINVLKKHRNLGFDELVNATKINKDALERVLQNLRSKGIVEIETKIKRYYILTDEGREYLESGLPERRVLEFIKKGINTIGELNLKYNKAELGIIWLKADGLIIIERGNVQLTDKARVFLDSNMPKETLLEKLRFETPEDEIAEKEILKEFLKRNIVREVVEKDRLVMITEKGIFEEFEVEDELSQLTPEIIKRGLWKEKKFKKYELVGAGRLFIGKIHFYNKILQEVREFLISYGFQEFKGKIVESCFWNCDVLFMPSRHVARDIHDIFFIDHEELAKIDREIFNRVKEAHLGKYSKGWGYFDEELAKKYILRSHNTAISARVLYMISKGEVKIPLKMFAIDRVFRPDTIDQRHFIEFDQLEGIIVDEEIDFSNLLFILKELVKIFGSEEVKFKPAYFPFTEPSVEVFVKINDRYVEVGGAGIFREEVVKPFNLNVPVLAWGIGIGRLVMMKTGINDIRDIMSRDIDFLRNI